MQRLRVIAHGGALDDLGRAHTATLHAVAVVGARAPTAAALAHGGRMLGVAKLGI